MAARPNKPLLLAEPAEPIDDETVAGRAVEEDEQRREEEEERDEQSEQLVEEPPAPVAAKLHLRRLRARRFDHHLVHQNAWPSETVTAKGPSPFWRLSGIPTSTRIGPNSE